MQREESDQEEEVVMKKIPTKPVERRAPKAREFVEVQNKKIDLSHVRSKMDTGRRPTLTRATRPALRKQTSSVLDSDLAPSTTRVLKKSTKKKKVSPRAAQDSSTIMNSVDESMSKLSPRTIRKNNEKSKKSKMSNKTINN